MSPTSKTQSSNQKLPSEVERLLDPKPGDVFKKLSINGAGKILSDYKLQEHYEAECTFPPRVGGSTDDRNIFRYSFVSDDASRLTSSRQPFPMAIRGIRWMQNQCHVLLEQAPSIQNILWYPGTAGTSANNDPNVYSLPFPWTQFLFSLHLNGGKAVGGEPTPFFSQVGLMDMKFSTHAMTAGFRKNVHVYRVPLPNTYGDGHMCFAQSFTEKDKLTFVEAIERVVSGFYGTTFNLDLSVEWNLFSKTKFEYKTDGYTNFDSIFKQWAEYSLEDMIDPDKIPFAKFDTEEYWKKAPVFNVDFPTAIYSSGYVKRGSLLKQAQYVKNTPTAKITVYDKTTAKASKVDMKKHKNAAKALHAMVALDAAADTLFNKFLRPQPHHLGYHNMRTRMLSSGSSTASSEIKALASNVTDIYKFKFGEDLKDFVVSKVAGSYVKTIPEKSEDLVKDLGKMGAYNFDLDFDKFMESLELLRNDTYTGSTPVPPGLRYWDPGTKVVVFERPPAIKTVTFYGASKEKATQALEKERESYKLFIPWTQYWVSYNSKMVIQSIYATCSAVPMGHKDWKVGILPLPNMYYESRVCTPNVIPPAKDIAEIILHAYNAVWASNYNMDLADATHLFVEGLERETIIRSKHYTPEQIKLANSLREAYRNGSFSEFFKVWQSYANPHDLMKILTCVEPRSEFHEFEEIEGTEEVRECTCGSSEYEPGDEDYFECECSPEAAVKQLPLNMHSMILATLSHARKGWFSSKLMILDRSIFSMYDAILLHGQAYQQKMIF